MAPFFVALWIATRPPATSKAAAEDIFVALEKGDTRTIYKFLIPHELTGLGLNQQQTEKILAEEICPAFSALNVEVSKKQFLPGNYLAYFVAPFTGKGVNGRFTLGILEHTPGVFQTSLTYLFLGISQSEASIGKKTGREKEVNQAIKDRTKRLEALGMKGLYDVDTRVPTKWYGGRQ